MAHEAAVLIDLTTLARLKGLPVDTLRHFGVSDRSGGGVRIEYLAPDARPVRSRIRLAATGRDGSRWQDGEAPVAAYWRPLVKDLIDEHGVVLVCEGESSCWTAWHAGVAAVGIPGGDEIPALWLEHVASSPVVVVVVEPEDPETYPRGRHRFLADLTDRLRILGYAGRVTALFLDELAPDLNALYRADPLGFPAKIRALIANSLTTSEAAASGAVGWMDAVSEQQPRADAGQATSSAAADIANAVARTRGLIGFAAPDVPSGVEVADWLSIGRFVESTGDENPLYTDVRYGARSAHGTLIAPPTFVLAVRMPDSSGALDAAPHQIVDSVTALQVTWSDHVRLADRLRGRVLIADAGVEEGPTGCPSARVLSSVAYERNGAPFAHGQCEVRLFSEADSGLLRDRSIHRYSDTEIETLVRRLEAEPERRGETPRFWSRTHVGEVLPSLIKGPLTFSDLFMWKAALARPMRAGSLHHRDLEALPGRRRTNPVTGWPTWDRLEAWDDSATASAAGLPAPATPGGLLFALAGQLVTHWMGDDAFLRRLAVRIAQPLLYGDALTLTGSVVERLAATDEAGHRYHAITLELAGRDQLQGSVLAGEAVVLLPDPGKPVAVPVSGELRRDFAVQE